MFFRGFRGRYFVGILLPIVVLSRAEAAQRAVALTFDDVPGMPVGGDCDRGSVLDMNQRLLRAARVEGAPVAGLVTQSRICDALRATVLPEVLSLWLDAGAEMGNHTFSHPDLNRTPIDAYMADVVRGERVLDSLLSERGSRIRYFRYPQLHTGDRQDKKDAIEGFLAERGYLNAPVTIDSQEWVFAGAYTRALAAGDKAAAQCIAGAYVPFMETVVAFFEEWSLEVLGYEPSQILLLHANELNADRLPDLLSMLRGRGYEFVTLDEALADSAYAQQAPYVGRQGLSWIHRWALSRGLSLRMEPREPEWITRLNRPGASLGETACPTR